MPKAKINGIELFWREAGEGDPLLLLHGFPLNHTMWESQVEFFSGQNWRVIAPDQRGYGQSSLNPDETTTMDLLAQDAAALLDYLNIEKAVVVGLSMGGYVSFALYRQFPQKVRALVLADTKAEPDPPAAREGRYQLREAVREKGSVAARDVMVPKYFAPAVYSANLALVAYWEKVVDGINPEAIMATLPGLAERPDSVPLLPQIKVPALVIHGEQDTMMPVEGARQMAQAIPGGQFVAVAGAGHMSNLENSEFFNQTVESFLQALP